jgi:hypothetical protein
MKVKEANTKLKPCAHCASDRVLMIRSWINYIPHYRIFCKTCQCRTGAEKRVYICVDVWNKRPKSGGAKK